MFDARRGAWSTFQFLVRERLDEQGVRVGSDGRLRREEEGRGGERCEPREAGDALAAARGRRAASSSSTIRPVGPEALVARDAAVAELQEASRRGSLRFLRRMPA